MFMIKGFGAFAFVFFLFLCASIGSFGAGLTVWLLSVLLVVSGTLSYSLFAFPSTFESHGYTKLKKYSQIQSPILVSSICDVAAIVRKDGLFAADTIRKELKDPWLQYSLKKMIEGFDQSAILPAIRNEQARMLEHCKTWLNYHERISSSIPLIGLVGSLCHLMADLSGTEVNSVSAAFIPFLISILFQLAFQSWYQSQSDQLEDGVRLYYSLLENGISGISSAISSEVLKEQLEARITHA